ncbi:MAG: hypothetical protein JWO70_5222 [Betaproteobacteria bacterium]|jgi:hypothetical protein|nr:hypothetical protein [Betaproteobacteria bacterium]
MIVIPDRTTRVVIRISPFILPFVLSVAVAKAKDERRPSTSALPACAPGEPTPREPQPATAIFAFAGAPIAAFTRGITSFAISSMERFASFASTKSIPA